MKDDRNDVVAGTAIRELMPSFTEAAPGESGGFSALLEEVDDGDELACSE